MPASTNSQVVTIASDGDLHLEVGQGKKRMTLQVSNAVLISTSKYFAALTSPRFSEGQQQRSVQNPQTINLHEDDPQAMQDMCMLLHGQEPALMPRDGELRLDAAHKTASRLLQLAVAVDKYNVTERLALQTSSLLFTFLDCVKGCLDSSNKWNPQLVGASYLFNAYRCFRIATEFLTMQTANEPGSWPNGVPKTITEAVRHKKLAARDVIFTQLPQLADDLCNKFNNCSEMREARNEVFGLDEENVWPGDASFALEDAVDAIRSLTQNRRCSHSMGDSEEARKAVDAIEDLIEEVKQIGSGLCLDCVRAGEVLTEECTIKEHKYISTTSAAAEPRRPASGLHPRS